jgi:hypothetical protein
MPGKYRLRGVMTTHDQSSSEVLAWDRLDRVILAGFAIAPVPPLSLGEARDALAVMEIQLICMDRAHWRESVPISLSWDYLQEIEQGRSIVQRTIAWIDSQEPHPA